MGMACYGIKKSRGLGFVYIETEIGSSWYPSRPVYICGELLRRKKTKGTKGTKKTLEYSRSSSFNIYLLRIIEDLVFIL